MSDHRGGWWRLFVVLLLLASAGCARLRGGKGMERIREQGVLRVAIDPSFPPFEFIDGSGTIVGLDADIAQLLADHLGVELQFVTTTYDGLYDALTTGRADIIISALYPDPTRTQDFAFSYPYFNAGEMLVVLQDSPIQTLDDVSGRTIIVALGTDGQMEALRWQSLYDPPPRLITVEDEGEVLQALLSGNGDGAIVGNLLALSAQLQGVPIRIIQPPVTDEIYVIAARREDADLVAELSTFLQQLDKDGTMDRLIERWLIQGH